MAGQLFSVNSLGGFYASFNLSKELRMGVQATSKFRQFCDIKDAFGKVTRSGQTFTWDRVPMMTRASRALAETNTIPQGAHTVLQATLTMSERGFSVPYTQMLEALSSVTVRQPIMKVLKYDAMCDLDCLVHQQFNRTHLRASATATTAGEAINLATNGTAALTALAPIGTANVKAIVDKMKERNIPRYEHDDYYAIARPTALRGMKNTLETLSQYTSSGFELIMNGEIGRSYENVRFVEQTVIPAGGAADTGTTFDPFTDTGDAWGSGVSGDWVFFFGSDTVVEAVETMEEIRAKIPDDYGRSKGIAWYALLGYGLCDADSSNTAQQRVVKWDSAV